MSDSLQDALSRRRFLWQSGGGLAGIALAGMLQQEQLAGAARPPQFAPKAKRVVQLFMAGAASHVDLFDYKPELIRRNGQKWDPGEKVELFQNGLGATMASPWKWKQYGDCGKHLSDIVAPLGACADDIAFVHSLTGATGVHSQATYLQATGFSTPGFPGAGSWVSYGLGSENQNLPAFVVLPDRRGYASNGPRNWSSGFLPADHQGVTLWPGRKQPVQNLFPAPGFVTAASDAAALQTLQKLNGMHLNSDAGMRAADSRLSARMKCYELAARMQLSAPEALDLSREPAHVLKMYGLDHGRSHFEKKINAVEETDYFGRKCLIARRLLERGVRYVQIWSGCDNGFPRRNWDSHEDIARDHGPLAAGMSRGAAALIQDLKQRGMLEDTLIHWTTEFGRMPCTQGSKGRDHNPFVFTTWLAGGGIKGGVTYGPSDEWGYKPADRANPTQVHDIHATMLHLLGIDHKKLTVRHNGIDRRLTDVHGHVIKDLIA